MPKGPIGLYRSSEALAGPTSLPTGRTRANLDPQLHLKVLRFYFLHVPQLLLPRRPSAVGGSPCTAALPVQMLVYPLHVFGHPRVHPWVVGARAPSAP